MRLITTIAEMRRWARDCRERGRRLGLVPTMGALHEGHFSLVRRARSECDAVVVSIFVNPTQFGPTEDLSRYPHDLDKDVEKLRSLSPHAIFTPSVAEMYPEGAREPERQEPQRSPRPQRLDTFVEPGELGRVLEGAARPGHFRGVATVVLKLFYIVNPDAAYFGQKDFQQTRVIARLIEDFNLYVRLIVCPIVREPDGLAMSSRNAYLRARDRQAATVLYRALEHAETLVRSGETSAGTITEELRRTIAAEPRAELDYAVVVEPDQLRPVETVTPGSVALVAARVGPVRLIDNLIF